MLWWFKYSIINNLKYLYHELRCHWIFIYFFWAWAGLPWFKNDQVIWILGAYSKKSFFFIWMSLFFENWRQIIISWHDVFLMIFQETSYFDFSDFSFRSKFAISSFRGHFFSSKVNKNLFLRIFLRKQLESLSSFSCKNAFVVETWQLKTKNLRKYFSNSKFQKYLV